MPSAKNQIAVIPNNTTISNTTEVLAAFFNKLGGVRLDGENAVLHLSTINAGTAWYASISGTGKVIYDNDSSNKSYLSTYCDLSAFWGNVYVSNACICAKSGSSLGVTGRSKFYYYSKGGEQRLELNNGWSFHGDVNLKRHGQFVFANHGGTSLMEYNDYTIDQESISVHGNGNANWRLCGKITGRTDANNSFNPYSASEFHLCGVEKYFNKTMLIPSASSNFIETKMHTTPRAKDAAGAGQNQCNVRVGSSIPLYFRAENVFDTNCFLQVGYANGVDGGKANKIDLGGYDQQLGTLGVWSNTFDPTTVWNTNLVITSASPAKLTIYGRFRTDEGTATTGVYPGLVNGAASIELNSLKEVMQYAWGVADANTPGKIRFNCPGSDTTGSLSVKRGLMEIMPTATFSNLNSIVVSGEGVMKVGISELAVANEHFTVAIKDSTATLELVEGTSNVCYTCEIPGGQYLDAGVYSGTAQEGATYCEYLSGKGVLEVKFTPWVDWPAVGTKTKVAVPANTELTITDADVEKVEALESIECMEGVTLLINTTEKALDLKAAITGPVVITVASTAAPVTLSGDNSGIVAPGGFNFNGSKCVVMNEYGLGSTNSATALFKFYGNSFNSNSVHLLLGPGEGYFTNSAPIKIQALDSGDKKFYFGSTNATDHVYQNADFTLAIQNGVCFPYFTYNMMIIGGTATAPWTCRPYHEPNSRDYEWGFGGTAVGEFGHDQIIYRNYMQIGGTSYKAAGFIAPDGARNVMLMKSGILTEDTIVGGYANGTETTPWINFNGTTQTVAKISQNGYSYKSNHHMTFGSTEPALLKTISETSANAQYGIVFIGKLAYWHATKQNLVLSRGKSTSKGELTVSDGSVTFTNAYNSAADTGWSGPVTVKNGGVLKFYSPRAMTDYECLTVEEGGALHIEEGVTLCVKSSSTFGAVALEPNTTYTVAEINALFDGEPTVTLTGAGCVQTGAKSISGTWAGWPEVGTATTVAIPDGTKVTIGDDDLVKVKALELIDAGIGVEIRYTGTADEVTIEGNFAGNAKIYIWTNGKTVKLAGDSSGIIAPGGFSISNTVLYVEGENALGGATTAAADIYPASSSSLSQLYFESDGVITNYAALTFNYGAYYGITNATGKLVQAAKVTQNYGNTTSERRFYVKGDVTIATGNQIDLGDSGAYSFMSGANFRLETNTRSTAWAYFGSGSVYVGGELYGSCWIEQVMTKFVFEAENRLYNLDRVVFYDQSATGFVFDLNGYNQTVPRVIGNSYGNASQQYLTVKSDSPATLFIKNDRADWISKEAIQVLGQASLAMIGTSTQYIGYATSTSKGSLIVNSGALVLEKGAKWSGDVELNGGALIVAEDTVAGFMAPNAFRTLKLNGGKLALQGANAETTVYSAYDVKTGEYLTAGDYTSANCDWVESGTVHVKRSQAARGVQLFIW